MKKLIPLKIAKKILNDSVTNTYTNVGVIASIADFLKSITLSYAYGEGNSEVIYDFIYGRKGSTQEEIIDFLYEVYYCMQSYGYGEEYLKELRTSVTKYMDQSYLSEQIKGMAANNSEEGIDILFGIFVFLRMFLRQLDAELIKRVNNEQRLEHHNKQKGKDHDQKENNEESRRFSPFKPTLKDRGYQRSRWN